MSNDHSGSIPARIVTCAMNEPCGQCSPCRTRAVLNGQREFDRTEVAYLISRALRTGMALGYADGERDGWDAAQAQLQAAIAAAGRVEAFTERWHRMEGYRVRARREHDIAARFPWHGDHQGGPVPAW